MTFVKEITIGNIISILSCIAVLLGFILSIHQWKKSNKLRRAEYIKELTSELYNDEELKKALYLIDYGKTWYDVTFHGGTEMEKVIDKMLFYYSYICYLKKMKLITKKEFMFFQYKIERTLNNRQIIDYFYNLYHFANAQGVKISFEYLFEYGEEIGIFNFDFHDKSSINYPHYLNY